MTFTLLISSQKGGVGKTTVATNIAAVLRYYGNPTLLIDTDIANPSVTPFLGISSFNYGLKELLDNDSIELKDAIISYQQGRFDILPAAANPEHYYVFNDEKLSKLYNKIKKLDYKFIIIDTAPASFIEALSKYYDEALIVTTPDPASVLGASRLSKVYQKHHMNHRLIINRVEESKFEMKREDIEKVYGDVAYAIIPEDPSVKEAINKMIPAYIYNRGSPFSIAIENIARAYLLKAGSSESLVFEGKAPEKRKQSFIDKLKEAFGKKQ
ncbi:MAG: septum site-determining protein MinD [Candidatus Micrarchaeota archaeon]|nr:MAG: septum site-determining protein MinD [Candidatus Micrarchaeota archaeon]